MTTAAPTDVGSQTGTTPARADDHDVFDPRGAGDERALLHGFLARQRALVRWKLSGADTAVLQSVTTPGGLTALGLVGHLRDVERVWWLEEVCGRTDLTFAWTDGADEFAVDPGLTVEAALDAYDAATAECDVAVAALPLDQVSPYGFSVRWVYLHLLEELARHLGHLDLLRELADGATGEDPPRSERELRP